MLRPLDRARREGPLYPGADRRLRDLIDPKHLLIRIDTAFDFATLSAELEHAYVPERGRPAIPPEVVLRALLLAALYQVPSYRQLVERISENLAFRWFCHLTLDDPVVDHSTLSVFVSRVGRSGLEAVVERLNASLLAAGLLSTRLYLDSSLLPAAVQTSALSPRTSDDPPPEPEGEVFVTRTHETGSDEEPAQIQLRRYQDALGRLPLPLHDLDARWRTIRGRVVLGYAEHLIVDRSGFILARESTGADVTDAAGALPLLDRLPVVPTSLTADSGYRALVFRRSLRKRGIPHYIPLGRQQMGTVPPGFIDHGDHMRCPQQAILSPRGFPDEHGNQRYAASARDCQPCPLRSSCVAPAERSKALNLSIYRREIPRAKALMATRRYAIEQRRRQTVVEGVFARLDRLGGIRLRVCGLERVNAHNALAALAHNILKALTKRRFWHREAGICRPPAPARFSDHPVLLRFPCPRLSAPVLVR